MSLLHDHWSCSRLAGRLWKSVGHPKPRAATLEEWGAWRRMARTEHPKLYWLTETALDTVRKVLAAPWTALDDLRRGWIQRVVRKTHYLPTGLAAGRWYEPDERLLHGAFQLLVDHVEIDLALKNRWCHNRLRRRWRRWGVERSREDGLSYLEWETTLDGLDLPDWEASPDQARAAREVLELYRWWTEVRPARPDPHAASDYPFAAEDRDLDDLLERTLSETERAQQRAWLLRLEAIQEHYRAEDDAMLARLVKVRRSLWT